MVKKNSKTMGDRPGQTAMKTKRETCQSSSVQTSGVSSGWKLVIDDGMQWPPATRLKLEKMGGTGACVES